VSGVSVLVVVSSNLRTSRNKLRDGVPGEPMRRVLIVDCHGLYRKGLQGALRSVLSGYHVLEFASLECARREFEPDGNLDLVLVDLNTPGVSFGVLRAWHGSYPKTRLAVMSAAGTRSDILQSLDSGLFGFISKLQPDEEILSAIQDMLSGRVYVPLMLTQVGAENSALQQAGQSPAIDSEMQVHKLTPRQREVLPLLARGMSNKEIARALKIAEGTTKIHASGLLRVLGVRNRTEAAVAARSLCQPDQMGPLPSVAITRSANSRRR